MKQLTTDVAIIGLGSAGLNAYRAARTHTDKILSVQHGPYGTTCARVGCMPSKLLIAAAETAQHIRESSIFGIHTNAPRIDGKEVMARVRGMRDEFVTGVITHSVEAIPEEHRLLGYAKFLDDHTLQIDDHTTINFKTAVIATGSTPALFPFFDPAGDRLITNDEVFAWDDLPESVAIFGPGVIGLELGQALHRLGVRIRMFGKGGFVGPLSDPEVKELAERTFAEEFYLDADAPVSGIEKHNSGVTIHFQDKNGAKVSETFDYLLATTGRWPNVKGLGLENTSLELDPKGVPLFDKATMQCGTSNIFIAGDAANYRPLLHEASDEGRTAGNNAGQYPTITPGLRRAALSIVFTDPQIAMAGYSYGQLTSQNCCFATGKTSFASQGRARVFNRNKGSMHIYADATSHRLLGAEILGPDAEHMAHLLAWVMQQAMTVEQVLDLPFYHPVLEEGMRTALRDLKKELDQGNTTEGCTDCSTLV